MNALLVFVFCSTLLVTILGSTRRGFLNKGRIIGGTDASAGQFPYMAAINVTTSTSRFFCGGALANSRWTITSGTCVYNATLFTISLGSLYLNSADGQTFSSSMYEIHPDFDPDSLRADIGLIRLHMFLQENDYIRSLIPSQAHLNDSAQVYALGWGHTSDFDSDLSNRLKYVNVTVLSNAECQIYFGQQVTENMTCVAGEFNEGTCNGDTGGPLAYELYNNYWTLGIASFISGNGCEGAAPSGYTRVEPYSLWIRNHVFAYYPPDDG